MDLCGAVHVVSGGGARPQDDSEHVFAVFLGVVSVLSFRCLGFKVSAGSCCKKLEVVELVVGSPGFEFRTLGLSLGFRGMIDSAADQGFLSSKLQAAKPSHRVSLGSPRAILLDSHTVDEKAVPYTIVRLI